MLYLGIDGGGTKTEAVLCNEKGSVLRRVIVGPSAPSSVHETKLKPILAEMFEKLDLPKDEPIVCYAGISGCIKDWDRQMFESYIFPMLPDNLQMTVGGDGTNGLNAAFGPEGDGLLLIVGTGSTALMRDKGTFSEIGGWGHLLGDEGSGYDMGRRAVVSALRAFDGRGEATMLTKLLEDKFQTAIDELPNLLYEGGRAAIASCAGLLVKAAAAGDKVANAQLDECIWELRMHIQGARKKNPKIRLAFSGGLITHYPMIWDRLISGFEVLQPQLLDKPPVYGAVL